MLHNGTKGKTDVTLPFKHDLKRLSWFPNTKLYLWSATFTAVTIKERASKNVSTDLDIQSEISCKRRETGTGFSLFFANPANLVIVLRAWLTQGLVWTLRQFQLQLTLHLWNLLIYFLKIILLLMTRNH